MEVLGDTLDHDGHGVVEPGLVEQRAVGRGTGAFALGDEELLAPVLGADERHYRRGRAVAEENLALAVNDVLLEVVGDQFGGAEILHGFGNLEAEFFAEGEVCVYQKRGVHWKSTES